MLGNKHWIPTKIKTSDERLHTIHRYCSPMYYIPYFMSDLWNNTQIIDQSISSKFSYTHRNFGLLYLKSKICILHKYFTTYFDLIVSWYSNCYLVSPFFMHSEYKNNHTYLLLCTRYCASQFLNLNSQTKTKYFHFTKFHWLTKITHIFDGSIYLKRAKQLFDISIVLLSL